MPSLEALTREATAGAAEAEAARQLQICNACRYCEGYCAVFPAMTRRLEFGKSEVDYLANLCHNCGACLHACQYAPPHEFAVNVPQAMAKLRLQTYSDYAWPPALARLYKHNGLTLVLALAAGMALFLLLAIALKGNLWHAPLAGDFYRVFPHNLMVAMFTPIFLYALLALALSVRRFWNGVSPDERARDAPGAAVSETARDLLRLKYLDGGHGLGCNEADDRFTLWRRRFHHFTFYGFLLCFAATSVATLYHYLFSWSAPYALASLPVLLGTAGGIGMLIGPAGLLWLNLIRHPLHGDAAQKPMDLGFIALLFLVSLSGMALLAWRDTGAMALLLALHLAVVMALFLTLPYSKFMHAVYRAAALLKWAIEKRQPSRLQLGPE
ncbi:MAG: tricarballylate utilization 4Fe-4S protein TcuB [Pseudomonadota bacterium]